MGNILTNNAGHWVSSRRSCRIGSEVSFNQQYKGVYTEQSINFRTREDVKRIKTSSGKGYKVGLLTNQTIEQLMKHIQEQGMTEDDALLFLVNGRAIIPETANKHCLSTITLQSANFGLGGMTGLMKWRAQAIV